MQACENGRKDISNTDSIKLKSAMHKTIKEVSVYHAHACTHTHTHTHTHAYTHTLTHTHTHTHTHLTSCNR